MAEYVMSEGEKSEDVAKEILEHAGDRAGEIQVFPRPNVPGGQVFEVPDDLADGFVSKRLSRIGEPSGETDADGDNAEPRQSRAAARRAAAAAKAENKE